MKKGEIVEQVIRRSYVNLSDLARRLNVSRVTLYNWFGQDNLDTEVILKIGDIIHHDFSEEFPGISDKKMNFKSDGAISFVNETESVSYWRNKYISLLEKHNDLLNHAIV